MITKTIGVVFNGYLDNENTPGLTKPTKRQAIAYARSLTANKLANFDWESGDEENPDYWYLFMQETVYVDISKPFDFAMHHLRDGELDAVPVLADKTCFAGSFFARTQKESA